MFIGQLVAGLWLEEAGHHRVGMWLCLECLAGSFLRRIGGLWQCFEDGLVMELLLLLDGPEIGGSFRSEGPGIESP